MAFTKASKTKRKKLSKKRVERVRIASEMPTATERIDRIIKGAEAIIRMPKPKEKRLIFLGQRMRPLFEAVKALNNVEGKFPKKNVRYFVVVQNLSCESIARRLESLGIVSGNIKDYYLFDYYSSGTTLKSVQEAVRFINQKARTNQVSQHSKGKIGDAIRTAQRWARPTRKDFQGKLKGSPEKKDRDLFLAFSHRLQQYINKRKQK